MLKSMQPCRQMAEGWDISSHRSIPDVLVECFHQFQRNRSDFVYHSPHQPRCTDVVMVGPIRVVIDPELAYRTGGIGAMVDWLSHGPTGTEFNKCIEDWGNRGHHSFLAVFDFDQNTAFCSGCKLFISNIFSATWRASFS